MYFNAIEFGKRIQESRKKAGLTQEQLADLMGVDRTHITKIEGGTRACSIDFLAELTSALSVSADYLLTGRAGSSGIKEGLNKVIAELQKLSDVI